MNHILNVDLNLLKALAVLLEERHISRAADRLHLSQSAMSRALQRLRESFADELLVRSGRAYELTPRARAIQRDLDYVMPRLETMVRGHRFVAEAAADTFRMHCTDYLTSVLGRDVFPRLFKEAPRLSLIVETFSSHTFEDIERGRIDLMLGPVAAPGSLRWQTVFHEEFVCVLSSEHPVRDERLTLEHIAHYPHVSVVGLPVEKMLVNSHLDKLGVHPPSGLQVPYFSAAVTALPGTLLISVLPRRFAEQHAADPGLRIAQAPPELPPFAYGMVWHPRLDTDPAHTWLRDNFESAGRQLDVTAERNG